MEIKALFDHGVNELGAGFIVHLVARINKSHSGSQCGKRSISSSSSNTVTVQ